MEKLSILYVLNEAEELGGTSLSLENLMHSLGDLIEPILLMRKQGPVYDYFTAKGYECLVVPYRFNYIPGKGWFRNLTYRLRVWKNRTMRKKAAKQVVKMLEGRKIDLVHSNSSVVDLGPLIAKKLHVPHIWHIREFIDLGLGIEPIGGYEKWKKQVLRSNAVITISRPLFEHLGFADPALGTDSVSEHSGTIEKQQSGFCHSRVGKTDCYMLQDAVALTADRMCNPKKKKYFVFLAGRIHPIKSPELAVEAFSRSNLAMQGYKLKLTGHCSENMRWKLTSLAGKYGSPAGIEFHDFTDNVKELLSNASGFILCSKHEGLGRVMIESMFYGCPVLAYASGPSKDIITHGKTGLLFKDAEEGAEMMKRLANEDCSEMIEAAGNLAVNEYSEENYSGKIWKIYQDVMTRHEAALAEKSNKKVRKAKKKYAHQQEKAARKEEKAARKAEKQKLKAAKKADLNEENNQEKE